MIEPVTESRTRCILCGGDNRRTHIPAVLDYLTGEHFDIDACTSCGLMVTRPMPVGDEIDHYYPPRYRGNRHAFTGRMRVALRARAIEACFPRGFRGRLLDVGCGDGAFVLEMRRRGWDVCATEIDGATVERLRAAGVDARVPQDAERDGFDGLFDAVSCWHVLEHVERPQQVVQWVKTQLKPDGLFQASVPNAASFQARLFGKQWLHLDVPRHRYHFSPATMKALLTSAGLTVVRESHVALEYDWFGIIQSALNHVCRRPNWLFEALTRRAVGPEPVVVSAPPLDKLVSCLLMGPVAVLGLPTMAIARAFGDGATLTITCRLARLD
jgi:SAM-dependent methyltransferase